MSITTRGGDSGETSLWSGERVAKDHPRVEAYGTLDELGALLADARHEAGLESTREALDAVGQASARACAELASEAPVIGPAAIGAADVASLDAMVERLENTLSLRGFVVLGTCRASARIDVARAVARRAERRVATLSRTASLSTELVAWINRVSDALFLLARAEEAAIGCLTYRRRDGDGRSVD